ncbi:IniB N-terminal domain-containing protein, partial [Klebsiella pneumoniae]|nr:IniB N-terminal domain-containing protein [Klebsiella pneumoniae]
MVDTQHDQGRAESPTAAPGTHNETAHTEQPTVHEFLTQLATDPAARSAFIADPQATLDQAGLGDLTATDVLQATSLVLDYAPVEVVTEYSRSLQSSIDQFATSTQHVAINHLHPAHSLE